MDDDKAMDTTLRQALTEGCALDWAELEQRLGEIERLTRWALLDRQDSADGIVLSFDHAAAREVRDLVRRERECCGHLEFAVEESDQMIRVAIRSRPAASPNACCAMCGA